MIGFLKSLFFGKKQNEQPVATTNSPNANLLNATKEVPIWCSTSNLFSSELPSNFDQLFNTWIIGVDAAIDLPTNKVERQILTTMENLLQSDLVLDFLPRVPAIIPRLLRSLRDENIDAMAIAEDIAQDPTIVGEVIRVANSPYYRTKIQTSILSQALSKLGLLGLRQVIANIAFRSIIDVRSGLFLGTASRRLWKQTEKSAYAAGYLAKHQNVDIFDAYLAALVQNIGKIVQLRVIDDLADINSPPCSAAFYQLFERLSHQLSTHVVRLWDFPGSVVSGLEEQIDIADGDTISSMGSVLYTANHLGKLLLLEENNRIQVDLEKIIGKTRSNHDHSWVKCYKEMVAIGKESDISLH